MITLFNVIEPQSDAMHAAIAEAVYASLNSMGDEIYNLDWANTSVKLALLEAA